MDPRQVQDGRAGADDEGIDAEQIQPLGNLPTDR